MARPVFSTRTETNRSVELYLVDAVLLSHGSVPTLHMSLGILSQLLVFSVSWENLLLGVGLGTCLILHKYGFLSRNVFLLCTSTVSPCESDLVYK